MRLLILTLCLFVSFAASSEKLTIGEANRLLCKGIKQKDVDMVLEALENGAILEATDLEFGLTLYRVARREEFAYKPVLTLINEYIIGDAFALQQFRLIREIQRKNEAANTPIHNNNNNNNNNDDDIASDAGSGAELPNHNDFEAGSDAWSFIEIVIDADNATASVDSGYLANNAHEDDDEDLFPIRFTLANK